MKTMILARLVLIVSVLGTSLLFADDFNASVAKITGKVEVQTEKGWVPATVGQVLPAGTTVSTGFRSELQLKIGASTMTVKALSRLTIRELAKKEGIANTDLYLKVGKVDVDVKPVAGADQKFKVESPVSTASVRGTSFSFDGETIAVSRGLVKFSDLHGTNIYVPLGESAKARPPQSTKDLATNKDLVSQKSVTGTNAGEEFGHGAAGSESFDLSLSGFSAADLAAFLNSYNWAGELPNTYITLYGIKE